MFQVNRKISVRYSSVFSGVAENQMGILKHARTAKHIIVLRFIKIDFNWYNKQLYNFIEKLRFWTGGP